MGIGDLIRKYGDSPGGGGQKSGLGGENKGGGCMGKMKKEGWVGLGEGGGRKVAGKSAR